MPKTLIFIQTPTRSIFVWRTNQAELPRSTLSEAIFVNIPYIIERKPPPGSDLASTKQRACQNIVPIFRSAAFTALYTIAFGSLCEISQEMPLKVTFSAGPTMAPRLLNCDTRTASEKGKPVERLGRKASDLIPEHQQQPGLSARIIRTR
jgi:hypothetical protein